MTPTGRRGLPPRGDDPPSRPLAQPPDPCDIDIPDDPTEALDMAGRHVERVVQYRTRGQSQLPTVVDHRRHGTRVELEAQLGELASGARLHLTVTAHHASTLRWVVVGTACATVLSLVSVSGAVYAVAWLLMGAR